MNHNRRLQGVKRARRVIRIWRAEDRGRPWNRTEAEWLDAERHTVATRKPCSCSRCGNPRRWYGQRTPQEQRADEAYRQEMEGW